MHTPLQNAQKQFFLYQNNKSSQSSSTHFILDKLHLQHLIYDKNIVSKASNKFCEIYKNTQRNALADNAKTQIGKLRTYALFRTILCRKKYCSIIHSPHVLKCFTKLRISPHSLVQLAGRYNNTPVIERTCTLCISEVENEIHSIFICTTNNTLRKHFIESLNRLCKEFKNLCNKDKFIWLMSNECDNVIEIFANYIYSCF